MYNSSIHHRHTIRLNGYDYSNSGMYFITICTKDKEHLFGSIKDSIVQLSDYGNIAHKAFKSIQERLKKKISIIDYIIMPNHLHFIVEIKKDNLIQLKDFITIYKASVTKAINKHLNYKLVIWQRNYYEHIIRNEKEYYAIIDYIQNNPKNWMNDSLNS